jgi:hypothetical protein
MLFNEDKCRSACTNNNLKAWSLLKLKNDGGVKQKRKVCREVPLQNKVCRHYKIKCVENVITKGRYNQIFWV